LFAAETDNGNKGFSADS